MNLRDIKYLLAVAETRHFGRAAERCFVSQPTLSGQIKKLEDELGIVLFERTNRSVAVTPVGEQILAHARLLIEQANTIQQLAQANRDPLIGPLRIGIIPTLSTYLLPLILSPLRERYPQLKLVLSEDITDNLLRRLHMHEIDAALLATLPEDGDLVASPLFEEPFWLAYPQNHPLQYKETIHQHDLNSIELLLLADGHCLTQQVMQVCRKNPDQEPSNVTDLRATSLETLLQLVGAGFGCTLVPALAVSRININHADVVLRQLKLPDALRRIQLIHRSTYPRKAALQAFTSIILEHLPTTVHRIHTTDASRLVPTLQ